MKPIVIVMVGLPASGKSYKATELSLQYNAEILSSDAIRKELFGDERSQENNELVFKTLYERANKFLLDGVSVIIDSTNTTLKSRKRVFDSLNKIPHVTYAYIMTTPVSVCKDKDEKRDRHVGNEVIEKFNRSFTMPHYFEGFDKIFIDGYEKTTKFNGSLDKCVISLYDIMKEYNQHNPHHIYTLGEHCKKVSDNVFYEYLNTKNADDSDEVMKTAAILKVAGYLHDVGKMLTCVFDKEGIAHYYNHDSVGTYYLLSHLYVLVSLYRQYRSDIDVETIIEILFYVNYHMRAHNDFKSEKSIKKYTKLFGEDRFNILMLFGLADRKASGTYKGER